MLVFYMRVSTRLCQGKPDRRLAKPPWSSWPRHSTTLVSSSTASQLYPRRRTTVPVRLSCDRHIVSSRKEDSVSCDMRVRLRSVWIRRQLVMQARGFLSQKFASQLVTKHFLNLSWLSLKLFSLSFVAVVNKRWLISDHWRRLRCLYL